MFEKDENQGSVLDGNMEENKIDTFWNRVTCIHQSYSHSANMIAIVAKTIALKSSYTCTQSAVLKLKKSF